MTLATVGDGADFCTIWWQEAILQLLLTNNRIGWLNRLYTDFIANETIDYQDNEKSRRSSRLNLPLLGFGVLLSKWILYEEDAKKAFFGGSSTENLPTSIVVGQTVKG